MRSSLAAFMGLLLLGATGAAAADRPDFNGTWKLDVAQSELNGAARDFTLLIEEKGSNLHVKEASGPDSQEDVSEFTCGTLGVDCAMRDGKEKATVSVYYNGSMLIFLKTHGRKGSTVEKQRLSLAAGGKSVTLELMPIEPQGKLEKLVLAKVQ